MTRSSTSRRRKTQGGYALLMIFLMAAIVALMLYQQLPRVAFESEREKEQLLIDRGEQYTRAIQLYYLANNRQYPTSIEDLEKREKRFLRRRFVDPFTGKDEWRIVHTNGTFLTDSLVTKPPTTGDPTSTSTASNTTAFNTSPDGQPQQPQINAAVLTRPSDRQFTPPTGFPQGQDPSGQPVNAGFPIGLQPQQGQGALPPITLQPGAVNQSGGLPPITLPPVGAAGGQGTIQPGQIPGQLPGQIPAQFPGQLPGQANGQGRGGVIAPFPGAPGPGGLPGGVQPVLPPGFRIDENGQVVQIAPVPGQNPVQGIPGQQPFSPQLSGQGNAGGTPPNPTAISAITQILTNPQRQNTTPVASGGNQVGAIAGVASTHKGPSIKVYKDQDKYELWEFVFSPTANRAPGAGTGQPPNGQGGSNQTVGGSPPTTFAPTFGDTQTKGGGGR